MVRAFIFSIPLFNCFSWYINTYIHKITCVKEQEVASKFGNLSYVNELTKNRERKQIWRLWIYPLNCILIDCETNALYLLLFLVFIGKQCLTENNITINIWYCYVFLSLSQFFWTSSIFGFNRWKVSSVPFFFSFL